jgi:ubiquinone/menaquinone biosynthesis C-methylase UbiE
MKSVEEWTEHWDAKAGIEDPVELNGYCLGGVPIDFDVYRAAVIQPTLELLELEPQNHVLEIGCGSGLILREIEACVERAVGTDLSKALLDRYAGAAETVVCAAHELPFEGEQFDRILMSSVIHYFPDLEYLRGVVSQALKLLGQPGILVIADALLGEQPPGTSYRWYTRREIVDLLDPIGLPYSIAVQPRLKREINLRYDIVVYKD